MTDQLREALYQFDVMVGGRADDGNLALVIDAASKWLAVTESEPIQYCEVHADQIMPHLVDVDQAVRCRWGMKVDGSKDCRFVPKLLVAVSDD